jgi:flagellin
VQAQKGKNKENHPMALTILNNIASKTAENALSSTQASLQKTLTQLSTGLKINSGSDDAAGLSIAEGMTASIAALTQSQQNASNGIGMLQTADGALSETTTLLNRAVTLATEASTSGITTTQATALNTEYQSILSEVNQIGSSTNYNGSNVFGTSGTSEVKTGNISSVTNDSVLTSGAVVTITDSTSTKSLVITGVAAGSASAATSPNATAYTANVTTAAQFNAAITAAFGTSINGSTSTGNEVITGGGTDTFTVVISGTADTGVIGTAAASTTAAALATSNSNTVYVGDGTSTAAANTTIATSISALSSSALSLSGTDLSNSADASTALTAITAAITTASAQRGTIGASVNRLTAASAVMASQVTNLQSAANSIQNADIGVTVANMTQYNVLQSTGMAALQQSNQAQQAVLKLVQ